MPNLNSFVDKPVLLLYESRLTKKISSALINKKSKKLVYFVLGFGRYTEVISPKKIEKFGENALVAINDLNIKQISDIDLSKFIYAPIDQQVYATNGSFVGNVEDIIFDDEFVMTDIQCGRQTIPYSDILTFGENIVLQKAEDCPKITKFPSQKVKKPKNNVKVGILDENQQSQETKSNPNVQTITFGQDSLGNMFGSQDFSLQDALGKVASIFENTITAQQIFADADAESNDADISSTAEVQSSPEKSVDIENIAVADIQQTENSNSEIVNEEQAEKEQPPVIDKVQVKKYTQNAVNDFNDTKVIANYNFLIGRKISQDILSYSGEIVATKGTIITPVVVDKMQKFGKLLELTEKSVY